MSYQQIAKPGTALLYNEHHAQVTGVNVDPEIRRGKASAWNASYNVICTVVGSGLLNLPSAVAQGGWFSIILLIILGVMATYTAVILIKCCHHAERDEYDALGAQNPPPLRTYGDIGEAAFGWFGRYFVNVQMHMTLIGVASVYLLLAGSNVQQLTSLSHTTATLICAGIVWLHVFLKTIGEVGVVSAFNVLVAVFLLVVVVIEALRNTPAVSPTHTFVNTKELPQSFATFAFAYGVHPVLPTIYESMRNPKSYNKMVTSTFSAVLAFYLPMSIVGYAVYGSVVAQPIYATPELKDLVIVKVVIWAITFHVLMSYAIVLNPSERALEETVGLDHKGKAVELGGRLFFRTLFVGITFLVALYVPDFGDVLNLVSSLTSSFTVFILPCIFYMKLWHRRRYDRYGPLWFVECLWNVIIICVATLGSVLGTYYAIQNLKAYVKSH